MMRIETRKVQSSSRRPEAMEAVRITPQEARQKVQSAQALLVCGYDDEETCRKMKLEGSILLSDLEKKVSQLPKGQEIIFYCG
jgi:hypothetical protein